MFITGCLDKWQILYENNIIMFLHTINLLIWCLALFGVWFLANKSLETGQSVPSIVYWILGIISVASLKVSMSSVVEIIKARRKPE